DGERVVEAQGAVDRRALRLRQVGGVGEERRRVARREVQDGEHRERDREEQRDRLQEPAGPVPAHAAVSPRGRSRRGSTTSRTPSPKRLKPKTARKIAAAGIAVS